MSARIAIDCRKIADFGIGTYLRGLLHGLAPLEGQEEYLLLVPPEFRHLAPQHPRFRLIDETSGKYSVRELFEVGRAAEREGATLFHSPHYVVPMTKVRVVVTIHDLIHLHQPLSNPLARLYALAMIRRAVSRADQIITVTSAVRREIEERYRAAAGRVDVIHNGVDARFRLPARRGLPERGAEEGRYFLFVGNPKPHKNLPRLIQAFARIHARHPEVKLVLAGSAAAPSNHEAGIISAGLVPDAELTSLYAGAIALVQPSLEEGFGLPVVEAMAAGSAVVVSSIPSLMEVAGDAAWRIDPFSVDSIEAAMGALCDDPALRSRMAAKAKKRADFFGWEQCAEATLGVYRSVIRSAFSR